MGFKNGNRVWNEIIWTPAMVRFLKKNYKKMTNQELSDNLGLKITSTRMKLYELGMFRMRLNYWTDEQVKFLKDNYKNIGDLELSEMFNEKFKRKKKWTKNTSKRKDRT
jgi:hypothetical protein